MNWSAALGVLLIVLFYGWRYISRVLVAVAPPPSGPPPESSADDDFRRRLANVSLQDLEPPADLHASEPWDQYWRRQQESGLWAFNEIFVDDRQLLRVIEARGFQSVLCVGAGLALEPHALAAAGLRVTMLDISRDVVAVMSAATIPSDDFCRILDSSQLRPGGSLECIAGDLTDPAVCPGPYDVVIERRTLQIVSSSRARGRAGGRCGAHESQRHPVYPHARRPRRAEPAEESRRRAAAGAMRVHAAKLRCVEV